MPEGPEIRLAADKVARVLLGHEIVERGVSASARLSRFEKMPRRVPAVTAVDTRGKAMLTRFDNGLTLYSHNQLYGRWFTMRRPRLPKTRRGSCASPCIPKRTARCSTARRISRC